MGAEHLRRLHMPPVEDDISAAFRTGRKLEIVKKWRDHPDRFDNAAVSGSTVLRFQSVQNRRQIAGVRHQPAIVAHVAILTNSGG